MVPAAQYLRMSTEKQEYSIENQEDALRQFAQQHGYEIVRTYVDAGKSGLSLRTRPGLRQLLRDVVSRKHNFNVVLVYDVSRWGRFQDYDEAGHYEFICRSTGIPVVYCAEPFGVDAAPTDAILKTLKRTMAAEFSRQLGVRVYQRKKALVQQGFRVGGAAPFGLRRVVVAEDGSILKVLKAGSRKGGEHRVLITLGPSSEERLIRKIFHMLLFRNMGCSAIARELNRKGTLRWGHRWSTATIRNLLTNPIYEGCNAWGRTSQKMRSSVKPLRPEEWVVNKSAFDAIVSHATFRLAQLALKRRAAARRWDDEEILSAVTSLLKRKGKLSIDLLERTRGIPGSTAIRNHFGGYLQLYERLGYKPSPRTLRSRSSKAQNLAMRAAIERRIIGTSPANISLVQGTGGRRIIVVDQRIPVSLYLCPMLSHLGPPIRWRLIPNTRERENISLVCLLDRTYEKAVKTLVLSHMGISRRAHRLKVNDPCLRGGVVLHSVEQFCSVVRSLAQRTTRNIPQHVVRH